MHGRCILLIRSLVRLRFCRCNFISHALSASCIEFQFVGWFFARTKWLRDRLDFFVGAAVRICIVLIGRRNWNAVVSKVGLIYTLT